MNISQWKIGDKTFFSLEVDDQLLLLPALKIFVRNAAGEYEVARIPYDAVLTVRLLLLRELRPEDWATFCLLQSSLAEWRQMAPWEHNQEERLAIIRDKLGMDSFSRDEILEVNSRVDAAVIDC